MDFTAFSVLFLALWTLFASIWCTIANIRVKTFIRWLWKQFYGIRHSIFNIFWGCFASIWCTVAKILAKTFIRGPWNRFYGNHRSFFSILEVVFCQSEVPLPRYGQKPLFAGFETDFTAIAVLFLQHSSMFCVNRMQRCKDTGENVYSPSFKPVLRHSPFYF